MKINEWLNKKTNDLQGRVVVLTGATGGLGSKLSRYLVGLHAKLIMVDYSQAAMDTLQADLIKEYPEAAIETIQLDLNDVKAVYQVAQDLLPRRIDFLILNAGVYNVPVKKGDLGYNNVFQINFISQYYLVKCLMPALVRTKGKVVATSSIAHAYTKLDENDLDFTNHKKSSHVYGNSKRFLTFALSELFKQQSDVRLAIVHPGVTLTPMTCHYPKGINWLISLNMKMLFPKPEVAALNILQGLFINVQPYEWIGPKRMGIWGEPTVQKITEGTPEERERVFNLAENVCKLAQKHAE